MDPIRAVAAISSFVSVGGALQKLLKRLGRYLHTLLHAVSQIATVADRVSAFSRQLIILQGTLEGLPKSLLWRVKTFTTLTNTENIKRQVQYEQHKTEMVFEAYQNMHRHAAESSEVMDMAVQRSTERAKMKSRPGMERSTE